MHCSLLVPGGISEIREVCVDVCAQFAGVAGSWRYDEGGCVMHKCFASEYVDSVGFDEMSCACLLTQWSCDDCSCSDEGHCDGR